MLGVVGVVEARGEIPIATALNHIISCYLSDCCFAGILQDVIVQSSRALELAHRGIDPTKSEILGEQIFTLWAQTATSTVPLDTLLDAVDEGAVRCVNNLLLLNVLGWCYGRVAVVL
jgi:hypothetical protein